MIEHDSIRPLVRRVKIKFSLIWIGLYLFVLAGLWGLWLYFSYDPRAYIFPFIIVTLWFLSRIYKLFLKGSVTIAFSDRYYDVTRSLAGPGFDGEQVIKTTPDSLIIADKWSFQSFPWPCLRIIHRGDHHSMLELVNGSWHTIPARIFDSTDEYRAFIDHIDQLNNAAGGWNTIVTNHLDTHHLRCAKCRYDLHKIPEARCSECGREVEHTDIRSSTTDRVTPNKESLADSFNDD